jgi:hypothetical protein
MKDLPLPQVTSDTHCMRPQVAVTSGRSLRTTASHSLEDRLTQLKAPCRFGPLERFIVDSISAGPGRLAFRLKCGSVDLTGLDHADLFSSTSTYSASITPSAGLALGPPDPVAESAVL